MIRRMSRGHYQGMMGRTSRGAPKGVGEYMLKGARD